MVISCILEIELIYLNENNVMFDKSFSWHAESTLNGFMK